MCVYVCVFVCACMCRVGKNKVDHARRSHAHANTRVHCLNSRRVQCLAYTRTQTVRCRQPATRCHRWRRRLRRVSADPHSCTVGAGGGDAGGSAGGDGGNDGAMSRTRGASIVRIVLLAGANTLRITRFYGIQFAYGSHIIYALRYYFFGPSQMS